MHKIRILITAGPTREYVDSVRYLSNGSSGKMGYACAAAGAKRGHDVVLVSGPVELKTPKGVRRVDVVSAAQMRAAVLREYGRCDAVIMTAAVSDYRPRRRQRCKIKKADSELTLVLEKTSDILAELGRRKRGQVLIGFAVEDRRGRANARRKLIEKNLDAIVLNSPAAIGADRSETFVLFSGGRWESMGEQAKGELAKRLIGMAEGLAGAKGKIKNQKVKSRK